MKIDIVQEFRKNLSERNTNPSLNSIYSHLFSLLSDAQLRDILEFYMEESETDSNWFEGFHKSIRQRDFFMGLNGYRRVNLLTEDENTRRNQLLYSLKQKKKRI